MRRSISITVLLTALLLSWSGHSLAQSWLDYEQALLRYPMLHSGNAATLTTFTPRDSSQMLLADGRLTMVTDHGHLSPLHVAPHAWKAQAHVRSIYRMSRRVVVRGVMDYSYRWGAKAGGTVWIDPAQMPFDITEVADSTRGNISLETYRLCGEAGVDAGSGVSLGARFDYTTASGAKKKDPRHTNSLMRCDASVGMTWRTAVLTLGVDYRYCRTTEALKFSTVGRTDQVYHYLIDHGALFGRQESTQGNGYTGSSNEHPILDTKHGVTFLANWKQGLCDWGVEVGWMHRHGHYGLESPSMIDFNRHSGDTWTANGWWQHDTGEALQRVTLSWEHAAIQDHERTYRIVTEQGVTDVNYYEDRLMGERATDEINLTADLQWGVKLMLPTWQLVAELNYNHRNLTASLFPYYRQQQTHLTGLTLQGSRHWLVSNDQVWSLTLTAGWSGGGGTAAHDGVYQDVAADAPHPCEVPLYLMRQYEYLTARRMLAGVSMRWSVPVGGQRMRLYSEVAYRYLQAFDIHYLENGHRHHAALSVGCQF